jgi:ABC-2 type transport system permease protein
MIAVWAIAIKELRLLARDWGALLMLFVLPAIFIVVLSVSLQGVFSTTETRDKLAVLVVNGDEGKLGGKILSALNDMALFRIVLDVDGRTPTRAEAEDAVTRGAIQVAVAIPPKASAAAEGGDPETIAMFVDPGLSREVAKAAEATIANAAYRALLTDLAAAQDDLVARLDRLSRMVGRPVAKAKKKADDDAGKPALSVVPVYVSAGDPAGEKAIEPTSVQQNVPGWTVFALFWMSTILAINLIQERESGAHRRLRVAPVPRAAYALGKALPFLAINLLQAAAMFAIGVYGLPHLGCPRLEIPRVLDLAVLTLAVSLVSIAFGLLFSTIARTGFMAASISATVLIIMTILGGIMVPKSVLPAVMKTMSLAVPHGWALDGYLDLLVRRYTIAQVFPQVAALLAFALGAALGALFLMRRADRDPSRS